MIDSTITKNVRLDMDCDLGVVNQVTVSVGPVGPLLQP